MQESRKRERNFFRSQNDSYLFRCANFAGEPPGFFFEWSDGKGGGVETLAEILLNKGLEITAAFKLGHVDELMHEQLTVIPAISADYDSVTDTRAARRGGDDVTVACDLREPLIVRAAEVVRRPALSRENNPGRRLGAHRRYVVRLTEPRARE